MVQPLKISRLYFCCYDHKLIRADEQYSQPYKTSFGEDTIDKSFSYMIKECEYSSKVTEIEFYKPLLMIQTILKVSKTALKVGFVKQHMEKLR